MGCNQNRPFRTHLPVDVYKTHHPTYITPQLVGAFCVTDYFRFFCIFITISLDKRKDSLFLDDMRNMKQQITIGELTLEHLSAFAERVGKTVSSVKYLCGRGQIPACKIGGAWYVNLAEYERTLRMKTEKLQ